RTGAREPCLDHILADSEALRRFSGAEPLDFTEYECLAGAVGQRVDRAFEQRAELPRERLAFRIRLWTGRHDVSCRRLLVERLVAPVPARARQRLVHSDARE